MVESIVVIGDILVMYVAGERDKPIPEQASLAFDKLEASLTSLKGRHFYGAIVEGEYRACVALRPEDEPGNLFHPTWTIPRGEYVRQKLADWEHHRELVGPTFGRMRELRDFDPSRPCVEYYRSQRELLLMA